MPGFPHPLPSTIMNPLLILLNCDTCSGLLLLYTPITDTYLVFPQLWLYGWNLNEGKGSNRLFKMWRNRDSEVYVAYPWSQTKLRQSQYKSGSPWVSAMWEQEPCLSYSLLCLQHLEWCLHEYNERMSESSRVVLFHSFFVILVYVCIG